MKQQTAVEWLEDKVSQILDWDLIELFEEAKAMEKDQIMNAYIDGKPLDFSQGDNARQYYNETYNK